MMNTADFIKAQRCEWQLSMKPCNLVMHGPFGERYGFGAYRERRAEQRQIQNHVLCEL